MAPRALLACAATAAAALAGVSPAAAAPWSQRGPTVAVVDSGVAPVPSLASRLLPGADLVAGGRSAGDPNGHGTAMASVVASLCGRCRILPVRVTDALGFGATSVAAAGVRWAAAHGALVISLSLAGPSDDPELDAAVADATAAGAVVVAAAGNDGSSDPRTGGYPAAAIPGAITVGAVDASGRLEPWSNHGAWVDVAAPGELTALGRPAVGTSAAAAFVSGVAGELLTRRPSLTPARVHELVLGSALPQPGLDVRAGSIVDPAAVLAAARRS